MNKYKVVRTSDGLRDLLLRHGVTPTMDRRKDIKLAKQFMPKPLYTNWSDMLSNLNMRHSSNNNKTDNDMNNQQIENRANKLWSDVVNGIPATFESAEETRTISMHSAHIDILDTRAEEIAGLAISNKNVDMYIRFEVMKLIKQQLVEAIEDFEV